MIVWDIGTLAKSLSNYLSPFFPSVTFAEGPNQQGTRCPIMFLQQRYSAIKLQHGGRHLQTIGLDLTYLEQYNVPGLQRKYELAAGLLDYLLETFPYTSDDSSTPTLLRTYEREWRIDQDAMHYKFEVRLWLDMPGPDGPYMGEMAYNGEVRDGETNEDRIHP